MKASWKSIFRGCIDIPISEERILKFWIICASIWIFQSRNYFQNSRFILNSVSDYCKSSIKIQVQLIRKCISILRDLRYFIFRAVPTMYPQIAVNTTKIVKRKLRETYIRYLKITTTTLKNITLHLIKIRYNLYNNFSQNIFNVTPCKAWSYIYGPIFSDFFFK